MDSSKDKLKKAISKVKFSDVGEKSPTIGEVASKSPNKYYPSVHISSSNVPFLKNSKVGDKKVLLVKAILKSRSMWDDARGKKEEYSLQIREIGDAKS